ncbi:hypothetical protein YT1_0808 [Rhodococcus ruber]|nr:hypothetical protein YT1_0808 [Rhodococcus ruber]
MRYDRSESVVGWAGNRMSFSRPGGAFVRLSHGQVDGG